MWLSLLGALLCITVMFYSGWRPSFKYYSMWLSLLGALLCITVMFHCNIQVGDPPLSITVCG